MNADSFEIPHLCKEVNVCVAMFQGRMQNFVKGGGYVELPSM